LWIGTQQGLFRHELDNAENDHFPSAIDPARLPCQAVLAIAGSRSGALWLGLAASSGWPKWWPRTEAAPM
jgi:hypothetical protein